MNTTFSSMTVQRFLVNQGELIELVEEEIGGLTPKVEQIVRAFDFSQIERAVYVARGYGNGRGAGQPEKDRCALACAFLAKAVLDLKTTRALLDRLEADRKLRRLCGFDLRVALPSEVTFSRAYDEFARGNLLERVHADMVKATLGDQLIGHISRDATAIEARERVTKPNDANDTNGANGPTVPTVASETAPEGQAEAHAQGAREGQPAGHREGQRESQRAEATAHHHALVAPSAKPKRRRGRPRKGEVRPPAQPSPLERQRGQSVEQMLAELDTACAVGTKRNAQGYQTSWKGYKLHLDTACCGVPISAVLTGANVHDSKLALPMSRITSRRVDVCYELMDAAYCSAVIREDITAAGRVALIDHNPRAGEKREFAPHEAQRYKTRSSAERCNARLKDEFGARHVQVRGHAKVRCHLMLGVVALCADQFTRLLQ